MAERKKRIAVNFGGGYVPGLNTVISGVILAANELGWDTVGILDGYEGVLFPDRYPGGGIVKLSPSMVEDLAGATGCILGTASKTDPFRVQTIQEQNLAEEVDRSDELLQILKEEKIDAVISVTGSRALSILWRLSRKGLNAICVPKSAENDIAATALSFGYNSALSFVTEILDHAGQAARSARRLAVVEVPGEHSGWLALQSGMAVCADAVLIPEIPYDIGKVAARIQGKQNGGRQSGLVVVAEGAKSLAGMSAPAKTSNPEMKAALCPGATDDEGLHVIERSGKAATDVALELQRQTDRETYPFVLGPLAKGGTTTAVDRQLGLGYGAGAVKAIQSGRNGVMVVFQPPDLRFVPMAEAINKVRTVPGDSEFIHIARSLGISLGD